MILFCRQPAPLSRQGNDRSCWSPARAKTQALLRGLFLVLALSLTLNTSAVGDDELVRELRPKSWRDQAELTDVFFLDPQLGWAVGSQGTIVRTIDGGNSWLELQQLKPLVKDTVSLREKIENLQAGRQTATTGVANGSSQYRPLRCRFESIHFVDAQRGWVLARYQMPYVRRSRSVVLVTEDGGTHWEPVTGLTLPGMRQIHFHNSVTGWVVGDSGNLNAGGMATTSDGGATWVSSESDERRSWRRVAQTGAGWVTIDVDGQLGCLKNQTYEPAVVIGGPAETAVEFHDLVMLDDRKGYAVGDYGAIVMTVNGGQSWNWIPWSQDATTAALQLRTLTVQGNQLWAAGRPGARLVSVDLESQTGQLVPLPTSAAINRVQFVSAEHGWAVGEFGTVLATTDGGQSWQQQRGRPAEVALMLVADSAADIPLEVLARYSVEESRICGLVILDQAPRAWEIARQAAERLGCTVTSQLMAGDRSEARGLLGHSNGATQGSPASLDALVNQVRAWQPPVVVYHGEMVSQAEWQTICRQARQPASAESDLGLASHSVSRLVLLDPVGPISLNPQRLLARTGQRVQETIAWSRALLDLPLVDLPKRRYRALDLEPLGSLRGDDLLSGLSTATALATGADRETHRSSLAAIQAASHRSEQLEEFARFQLVNLGDTLVWRRKLEKFALTMDRDVAGTWIMTLAQEYLRRGKQELAIESARMLATGWQEHPLAPAALSWLLRHYASQELGLAELERQIARGVRTADGRIAQDPNENRFATAPQTSIKQGVAELVWTPVHPDLPAQASEPNDGEVRRASAESEEIAAEPAGLPDKLPEFHRQRVQLAGRTLTAIQQRDPELAATPSYRWLEAQLIRRLDPSGRSSRAAENRFRAIIQDAPVALQLAAQREQQLIDGDDEALASLGEAVAWSNKPKLDGRLSEPQWRAAPSLEIPWGDVRSTGSANPIQQARLAYDDEFLYLGLTCQKLPQVSYEWPKQDRPRDADLTRRDRIWLCLDVDRDYGTGFHLEIDHRGWARESCDQFPQWDPSWYISQSETATLWTIEAAIPLKAILPRQPQAGDVWALRMMRLANSKTPQPAPPYVQPVVDSQEFRLLRLASPTVESGAAAEVK